MTGTPPKRKKKLLRIFLFFGVAAAIGAIVYFNLKKEKEEPTFPTVRVERGNLIDKLAETGSIELVRTVEIKSTIPGRIRELPVEAGDWVEEGQLLAVIEPDPNQSLLLYQKRSAVERGRLNLAEQEKDVARKKTLRVDSMVPAKELEDAEMRLTRARNDLRLARLELEVLETKADPSRTHGSSQGREMDDVRVIASISGIVIRRGVEIGEVVASGLSAFSGGTVLFVIGDPSRMIVRGAIAEIDIGKLEVGQEVEVVVDAYPDTTYHGRVRWIGPVGEGKQGSPIVTFDTEIDILDREPRLRQGMSCDIDIIFSRRDSVLYLPVETVEELFDTEDGEEEAKGRRGRFVAYVVRPASADSAAADPVVVLADTSAPEDTVSAEGAGADSATTGASRSLSDSADAQSADTTAPADSSSIEVDEEPDEATLEDFIEAELRVGLETNTRIEILTGLAEEDRVAADPELIRRKLERKDRDDESSDEDEDKD